MARLADDASKVTEGMGGATCTVLGAVVPAAAEGTESEATGTDGAGTAEGPAPGATEEAAAGGAGKSAVDEACGDAPTTRRTARTALPTVARPNIAIPPISICDVDRKEDAVVVASATAVAAPAKSVTRDG